MKKTERLNEIIDFLKNEHKLTNDTLSLALGYRSGNYVSDILGGSKEISSLFLGRLSKYFGVNPAYIEIGKLPKMLDISTIENNTLEEPEVDYMVKRRSIKNEKQEFRVPLVTVKARAGYVNSYDNIDLLNSLDKYAIPPGVSYAGAIWRYFEVDGDSMEPTLTAGDHVLCSQVPTEDWDNIRNYYVYVLVTDTMVTIKRVFVKDNGQWVLISDNETHTPQKLFDKKDLKELWVFRRLIKKTISAKKEFKIKI